MGCRNGKNDAMVSGGRGLSTNLGVDEASLNTAVVGGLRELVALIDTDFRVAGVNANVAETLGWTVDELVGTPALDLIAPADRERAALIFGFADRHGAMPGAAPFALVRSDGSTIDVDITGSDTVVGDRQLFTLVGRPTYDSAAIGRLLDGLLAGRDLVEVIEPVLDFFSWREMGSRIAISWRQRDGLRSVSTGLADPLAGQDDDKVGCGPWAQVRRTGTALRGPVDQLLGGATLGLAREHGLHSVWIEPVATPVAQSDPLVTVWASGPAYAPDVHAYAVEAATRYVDLALQWNDRARRLDAAAHLDDLTGLSNRRAFFDALSSGHGGGSVLFMDLDGFKTVNDRWGHATGDKLLVEVANRIADAVGEAENVSRIGGDEFAVALRGVTPAAAQDVVERIRAACAVPFELDGATVNIGISVEVAHDDSDLSEAVLHAADRSQYADKHRRAGRR